MADAILQQGNFTSDGTTKYLALRSDVDWIRVYNYTNHSGTTSADGVEFYWQREMGNNAGIVYYRPASDNTLASTVLTSGFKMIDTSDDPVGALNSTVTAVSTAATPVVSASSTSGLLDGDTVRMINVTSAQQLGGFDFTIGSVVTNTSFTLAYMSQLALAGTTGYFRKISTDPIFYPRRRYVSKITKASSAVVTLTVTHGYSVGQTVRFVVPAAYGMTEMNGLQGTITAVSTGNNTVTVNIDSTGFTTFAWPATADVPFTPAVMVPVGMEAIDTYENLLSDARLNEAYIGLELLAGAALPAGESSDVIYWVAGKSFATSIGTV